MSEVVTIGDATLWFGDCREVMAGMEANSVDAIVTDPPYFKVKGEPWDNQWDSPLEFLSWIGELCGDFARIMKPNASLYVFASPQMAGRVESEIRKRFNVLNAIVWRKGAQNKTAMSRGNAADKEAMRAFFPTSERLIFAEHYGADNIAKGEAGYAAKSDELRGFVFEPLRAYLDGERLAAGFDRRMCDLACGNQMSGHYFSRVQWTLPTEDNYNKLRAAFNATGAGHLRREYEDLRREYEDLRREYEDLRRPFTVTARSQWSDVWEFDPVMNYPGKHPCEKPQALLCHLLETSTRPGAVVFDAFAGHGSMARACFTMGRRFIGAEKCEINFRAAVRAIEASFAQPRLFAEPEPVPTQEAML